MNKKIKYIIKSALIAAIYLALTLLFAPISYSLMQIRIAEALSILAYFTPAAVPGLAIGCLLANLSSPFGLIDILFGTLATALSAFIAAKIKNKFLMPLPYVIVNMFIVGAILTYMLHVEFIYAALWVALGEAIAVYIIGMPLLFVIEKNKTLNKFFKD
jgi:uncharacterized membrane protein